jgi:hypothetical protein
MSPKTPRRRRPRVRLGVEQLESREMLNADFLTKVYRDVFGREPDDGGMTFYRRRLDQGAKRDQVITEMVASPEYNTKLVREQYQALFGRVADAMGLDAHVNYMANFNRPSMKFATYPSLPPPHLGPPLL